MLVFEGVSRTFAGPDGQVNALNEINLHVAKGELVTVEGPSGCGKTTLLLIAGALLHPSAGTVTLDGTNPYALSPNARSRLRAGTIGFVFQQFHLIPYLTVMENILAASVASPSPTAEETARGLVERLKLDHRVNHVPAQLSSGERQRTALARALLNRPGIILADEPTGNLDAGNAATVLGHLRDYVKEGGAVLLVTHDSRATDHADRRLHMQDGTLKGKS